jgi:hypothetical protein
MGDEFVPRGYCLVIGDTFANTDASVHKTAKQLSEISVLADADVVVVGLSASKASVYVKGNDQDGYPKNRGAGDKGSLMADVFRYLEENFADKPWIVVSNQADRGSCEYRKKGRTITHVVMGYNKKSEVQRCAQGLGRAFGYNIPHQLHVLATQNNWVVFEACVTTGQDALLEQCGEDTKVVPKRAYDAINSKQTWFGAPNSRAKPETVKRMRAAPDEASADILLPEEFLCEHIAALIDKADDLIAYIERLKAELKARGLETPTHFKFEDANGRTLSDWFPSDTTSRSNAQVHVTVKPHVPAVSYQVTAEKVLGATELFKMFCARNVGFEGTVHDFNKAIAAQFPTEWELYQQQRLANAKANGKNSVNSATILRAGDFGTAYSRYVEKIADPNSKGRHYYKVINANAT